MERGYFDVRIWVWRDNSECFRLLDLFINISINICCAWVLNCVEKMLYVFRYWFIYHFVKLLFQYKHHCTDVEDGLVSDELREKLLTWGPEGKCVRCLESEDKIRQLDSPDCVIKDEIVSDWRHRWSIKVINMYIYTTMYELVWTMVCHTSYIDFCLDRRYLLRWWCNNHQILC